MLKSAVLIQIHGHILCCKFSPLKKKKTAAITPNWRLGLRAPLVARSELERS